jgi:hypothetical protein
MVQTAAMKATTEAPRLNQASRRLAAIASSIPGNTLFEGLAHRRTSVGLSKLRRSRTPDRRCGLFRQFTDWQTARICELTREYSIARRREQLPARDQDGGVSYECFLS